MNAEEDEHGEPELTSTEQHQPPPETTPELLKEPAVDHRTKEEPQPQPVQQPQQQPVQQPEQPLQQQQPVQQPEPVLQQHEKPKEVPGVNVIKLFIYVTWL